MSLPEESQSDNRYNRIGSIITFILLLLIILGVSAFVYLKSNDVDLKNISVKEIFSKSFNLGFNAGKEYDAKVIEQEIGEFTGICVFKEQIVKCNNDYIRFFDKKGEEVKAFQVTLGKPFVKAAGSYLLAADIDGKDIYLISGNEMNWSKKLDGILLNADINEDGYVTVVHEVKGYKAGVTVYNAQGKESFSRTIAENFVLSARVVSPEQLVLINRVDTSEIKANTHLEYNRMSDEKPLASITLSDTLCPSLWELKDGSVVAVSDTFALLLDQGRKEKWRVTYPSVYSSSLCLGKYPVVAVNTEEKSGLLSDSRTEVKILSSKGRQLAAYPVESEVTGLETFSDRIAVNQGRQVDFINTKGKLLGKYSSREVITGIYFFNKQEVLVVTKNGMAVVNIN